MTSKVMRRAFLGISVVALMALLSMVAPSASALPTEAPARPPTEVVVYNGDGASMGGLYRTPEGELCGFYVDVGRSGSGGALTTNASVYLDIWDPTWWPCDENGCHEQDGQGPGACRGFGAFWGEIPNGDFARAGLTYTLKTTVTVEAWDDCGKEGCPDPPPPKPDPITVPVSLTWQRTPTWESTHVGTDSYRWEGIFQRSTGTWTSYSALGTGTFRNSPISAYEGGNKVGASVSRNRATSVCRVTSSDQMCGGK